VSGFLGLSEVEGSRTGTNLAAEASVDNDVTLALVGRRIERIGYLIGGALLISGLVHVAILLIGGGSWEGPTSLRKAATFGLSFGLTLLTIVWVSTFVPLRERTRTWLLGIFSAACVLETMLVSLQAWRGVPSHFNVETPFDAFVARLLAFGGMTIVVTITMLMLASFRTDTAVPVSLRVAIRAGFMALFGAQVMGALMIVRGMMLVVGGDPQTAYQSAGWLKPTHAVMMHGILLLPVMARLLSFTDWRERRRLDLVLVVTFAYVIVIGVIAVENVIAPAV
jgi:hypothetical protein